MNEIYEHAKKMTGNPEELRIAKWYSEANEITAELVEKEINRISSTGMCSINPPVCGALTVMGYFEWCIGGGSSREFARMFARVMDIVN